MGAVRRSERPLLQQLYQLYTEERQLAAGLACLFNRSGSILVRLALSDERRSASQQMLRLERSIQMLTGAAASSVAACRTTLQPPGSGGGPAASLPDHAAPPAFTWPLQAARAAVRAYGAALALARAERHEPIADLLAASLREKRASIAALSLLPHEPSTREPGKGAPAAGEHPAASTTSEGPAWTCSPSSW